MIPRTVGQYAEAARRHGLSSDALAYGVAIACPRCANGTEVIITEVDGVAAGVCNHCHASAAQVGLEFDALDRSNGKQPAERVAVGDDFRLYTVAELMALPEPRWLVEPFIPERGLVVLFGPSGTYKSFTAVDLAARVDGLAVYVSAEGSPRRFGERIAAWEEAAGRAAGILCHPYAINLLDPTAVTELRIALRQLETPLRIIVIDTTARNTPGADENSTQDTGRLIGVLDQLRNEFGCAVLAIAHTGHENKERERGSSALRGAADVSIRASRAQNTSLEVKLSCAKMRDAEEFAPHLFRLLPMAGSLVAAEAGTRADAIEQDVNAYLEEHPDASQREVEDAVTGRRDAVRAAYRKVRPLRPTLGRTPEQCAPQGGAPIKGAPGAQLPDVEDGGW